jgi:hypothetical protein
MQTASLKPALRAFLCLLPGLLALTAAPGRAAEKLLELDGRALPEASGLAVSRRSPQRLWLINDSGNDAELHALDLDTGTLKTLAVLGAANTDWEDLASFTHENQPWLAVADIGDNRARREEIQVHLLPEPGDLSVTGVKVHTTLHLTYPDGPRDAESMAIDSRTGILYVLSKRDPQPRLYSVDVSRSLAGTGSGGGSALVLEYRGTVTSIPPPSEEEIETFRFGRYRAQPTAMAFSGKHDLIAVLTYRRAYIARPGAEGDWLTALNTALCPVESVDLAQGETIAIDAGGALLVSSEGARAPLYRIAAECVAPLP